MRLSFRNAAALILFLLCVMAHGMAAADEALRRQIGQMIMTGFIGDRPAHPWTMQVMAQIERGEIGGVLYLKRNIGSPSDLAALNSAFRVAAGGRPAPLACIDQEGGAVARLLPRDGFPPLPAARRVARSMAPPQARELYSLTARALAQAGFDCNLGPVADLEVNPASPAIGALGRAYSADPQEVVLYARAFADAHREAGIATVLKHFPGHGSARDDSHDVFPDISRAWSHDELIPFRELIADGHDGMIMTGHLVNRRLDPSGEPATLSRAITTQTLRRELGWDGVVITDDLQMTPVAASGPPERTALAAIRAGADILLFANDERPDIGLPKRLIDIVEEAALGDAGLRESIERSHARIVALKQRLRDTGQ